MVFSIKGFFKWGARQNVGITTEVKQNSNHIEAQKWTKKEVKGVTSVDIAMQSTIDFVRNRY